jgi:hypothetical protein
MVASLTLASATPALVTAPSPGLSLFEAIANILGNPLAVVTLVVGNLVFAASFGLLLYLSAGAVRDTIGGATGLGRQPPRRD